MNQQSMLAKKLNQGEFIYTAEYLPPIGTDSGCVEIAAQYFGEAITAVNVADNPHGATMSSMAASVLLAKRGIEPIYQLLGISWFLGRGIQVRILFAHHSFFGVKYLADSAFLKLLQQRRSLRAMAHNHYFCHPAYAHTQPFR